MNRTLDDSAEHPALGRDKAPGPLKRRVLIGVVLLVLVAALTVARGATTGLWPIQARWGVKPSIAGTWRAEDSDGADLVYQFKGDGTFEQVSSNGVPGVPASGRYALTRAPEETPEYGIAWFLTLDGADSNGYAFVLREPGRLLLDWTDSSGTQDGMSLWFARE